MATEVLMSFANAGMGSIFATWLRRRIMTAKGLYDTRSVYMDNIAMREQSGTQAKGRTFKRVALQFPDTDGDAKAKFSAASWQLVPVDKVVVGGTGAKGDFAEVAAHKGGWVIGETQLQQVLKSI